MSAGSAAAVPDQPFHIRSISMPTRSHPLVSRVEEQMLLLRTSMAPTSPRMMCDGLQSLRDLYDCIDELLCLPSNRQALVHPHHKKIVEEELDGSLRLLDMFDNLRRVLVSTIDHIQDLQSSIRRNHVKTIRSKVKTYTGLTRKTSREIKKHCLASLKQMSNKCRSLRTSDKDCDMFFIDRVLMEAMEITLSVVQSISSFLSVPRPRQKISRWSLVAKALQKRKVACEKELIKNDDGIYSIPLVLDTCYHYLSHKQVDDGRVQYQLQTLEASIEGLEAVLEILFRRLIHHRVSLLNILSL